MPPFQSGRSVSPSPSLTAMHRRLASIACLTLVGVLHPSRRKMHQLSVVGAWGSYRAKMVGFDSSSLTLMNALLRSGPHTQVVSLLRSPLSGLVRWGVNYPSWFTISMNLLSSGMVVVVFISLIAFVLSGSACMPVWSVV